MGANYSEGVLFRGKRLPDGMSASQAQAAITAILEWESSDELPLSLAMRLFQIYRRAPETA
jgi:hypothetical protein